ncbi:hypothetical protein ACHAW5_006093 [Stephanodiscus triporus]|uniref:Uncharacterized protein n=1 Tax=Stephanodiscus triporus TaxID=2934178 RepID=A0ABD3MQX3_9STRA
MMSSIVRSTVVLLAAHICGADSLTLPYNFIGDNVVGSFAFCTIDHGTNLMNPQTAKITKTLLLPLATTHAGGNVIPTTTTSVAPALIDWNLLAATRVSCAAAPFVLISRMISVIISASSPKIVIQGEEVAMMPSPTILMRSALDACSASHVNALGEKEEVASAFEEAILHGLVGADANRMTSQTLEITKTRTLEEIFAGEDYALALGNEEKCALALAFEAVINRLEQITCKAPYKIPTYLYQDFPKSPSDPILSHVSQRIEDFLFNPLLYKALLFAAISMMICIIIGATRLFKNNLYGRGMIAIQPYNVLTCFTVVVSFAGRVHAQGICYGSYALPSGVSPGTNPFINGTINLFGDGWGENPNNITGWVGKEYSTSFVEVKLYVSGDQKGEGRSALAGQAFVGYTNPYFCVAAYLDYTTDGNTNCYVEEGSSAYVNYNKLQNSPNPKLTSETSGAIFKYVRYFGGTSGRVIGYESCWNMTGKIGFVSDNPMEIHFNRICGSNSDTIASNRSADGYIKQDGVGLIGLNWAGDEYSNFTLIDMYISGNRAGTNTSDGSLRGNADKAGAVYIGYDCETNTFCVAAYLLNIPANEKCEIEPTTDEAWVKYNNTDGTKPSTKKLDSSTPYGNFRYVKYPDEGGRTIGYEACWNMTDEAGFKSGTSVEVHMNRNCSTSSPGETDTIATNRAGNFGICLFWEECGPTNAPMTPATASPKLKPTMKPRTRKPIKPTTRKPTTR